MSLAPKLAGAEMLGDLAGLRSGRDTVRVEAEEWGDRRIVVHRYGHGGGVSLSWGCVRDVADLVAAHAAAIADGELGTAG
jgi:D-amino-acid oxidase